MIFSYKQLRLVLSVLLFPTVLFGLACSCEDNGPTPKSNNGHGVIDTLIYAKPTILRTIPHGRTSFTQGLLYADSLLYEGTGTWHRSKLWEIDPQTGLVLRTVNVSEDPAFGEGLALKDSQFVQLTYTQEKAYVYTYPGMVEIGTLTYTGQGWGLTNDLSQYIMSNGSDTLYFRDDNFTIVRKLHITLEGVPVTQLNELEYVNGKVWANVWYSTSIYQIDPQSGQVTKVIDCAELDSLANSYIPLSYDSVLNGIAFNSDTGTYFLTGKNWPLIFEVTIP
jgi:glutamine cyclotransferase